MDDANVPSLLSLPYLGYLPRRDPVYQHTRAYVLSNATNPWFFSGAAGEGVGSPHTGAGTVWPMAVIMRALTSTSDDEVRECLATLKRAAAAPGSWLMHESFHADDAASFTRPWFACTRTHPARTQALMRGLRACSFACCSSLVFELFRVV